MKSIISKTMALVAIASALLSFSPKFPQGSANGGEGFEISLNGKVIIQRYGKDIDAVNSLQLNQSSPNDQLTIKYYHCGRVGRNRIVTIKDGQNNLIKEWRFADDAAAFSAMTCKVKDILSLKNVNSSILKLYYSSSELPNGRLLASIVVGNNSAVNR